MSKKDKKKKNPRKNIQIQIKRKNPKRKITKNLRNLRKRTVEIRNCVLEEMQWNILSQIHLIMMMIYILDSH